MSERTWQTRDGRKVSIPNMTDSHLRNAINFVWRNRERIRLQWFMRYFGSSGPTGDAASWAYEQAALEAANLPLRELVTPFHHLLEEAESRGWDTTMYEEGGL